MTAEQILALQGIVGTHGYKVLLDVMEELCNESENSFIGAHPNNPKLVLAQHCIMHSERMFFQRFTARIDKLTEKKQEPPELTERERLNRILSAIPD